MVITIELAVCIVITGLSLGIGLALLRAFQLRAINFLIVVFSDVNRAVPPLVLVLLAYFGLPGVGLKLSSFIVLWSVLSLVLAAFAKKSFGRAFCRFAAGSGRPGVPPASISLKLLFF